MLPWTHHLVVVHTVDTDTATTRLVVDDWLTFQFDDANLAGQQLAIADQFRARWKRLVHRRLRDAARVPASVTRTPPRPARVLIG